MARSVGSKYDLATVEMVQDDFRDLSKRIDEVSFNAGQEIGHVSRATNERITRLDTATAGVFNSIADDQREIFRRLAGIDMELRALTWEIRHPWRTRWARVRAVVSRTVHRD